jgi:hypothetical protein
MSIVKEGSYYRESLEGDGGPTNGSQERGSFANKKNILDHASTPREAI